MTAAWCTCATTSDPDPAPRALVTSLAPEAAYAPRMQPDSLPAGGRASHSGCGRTPGPFAGGAIFNPLTFLAGVYGMNFRHFPELDQAWAYPAFWAVCAMLAAGMLLVFRRWGWL